PSFRQHTGSLVLRAQAATQQATGRAPLSQAVRANARRRALELLRLHLREESEVAEGALVRFTTFDDRSSSLPRTRFSSRSSREKRTPRAFPSSSSNRPTRTERQPRFPLAVW